MCEREREREREKYACLTLSALQTNTVTQANSVEPDEMAHNQDL